MTDKKYVHLFDDEIGIYQDAISYLEQEISQENELVHKFDALIKKYSRLINTARRLCRISDIQSKNLKKRELEIKNLLDHSDQGFLTFGEDLIVNKEYSSECWRIFNRKIESIHILELLHSRNEEQNGLFANVLGKIFKFQDWESKLAILSSLPNLIKIRENYINVKYKIINTDDFEESSERLMLILTDITEKRKTEDQVLFLSYHDQLTSLFNRGYVESIIPQLQIASNLPFSIIMADLNALKLTNDVFGHESGDKLIVNAAKVFNHCCRKSDIIARWGGDEFAILLPGANQEACGRICKNIKGMFETLPAAPIELSASLGAVTVENWDTDIISLMGVADSLMYSNKLIERNKTGERIVSSVENVLQSKYSAHAGHCDRVEAITHRFLKLLDIGQDPQEMANLLLLARLHDIGKIVLPIELLNKNTALNKDELQIMQKYPEVGYRMALSIGESVLAQAILAIREQWAGSGYPYRLKGEQIPILARIISIIEVYDVITHERPYSIKMSQAEALRELERCSGTQFDPNLIRLFLENVHTLVVD